MKQLHADLVSLGDEGSYNRVAAFAREWRDDRQRELQTTGRGTFAPLAFEPGEAFQFDWSEDWAIIGNERTKLQVAHTKLSYSRAFIVRGYLLQTHEMLFDAPNHAFRVFGGIPRRGIYDNMRTAIDKVGRGKERDVNVHFMAMASHYVFEPRVLQSCVRLGEGTGREECAGLASPVLSTGSALSIAGSIERLVGAALQRILGKNATWSDARHHCRYLG
jgi:hypothetical protein